MSEMEKARQWASNIVQAMDKGVYDGGWFKKDTRIEYIAELLIAFKQGPGHDRRGEEMNDRLNIETKLRIDVLEAERDRLKDMESFYKAELEHRKDEISSLKAEVELVTKAASCYRTGAKEGLKSFSEAAKDRDAWKAKYEELDKEHAVRLQILNASNKDASKWRAKAEKLAGAVRNTILTKDCYLGKALDDYDQEGK